MLEQLKKIVLEPGSDVGFFINSINLKVLEWTLILFGIALGVSLAEWLFALLVTFRAKRIAKARTGGKSKADKARTVKSLLWLVPPMMLVARRVRQLGRDDMVQPSALEHMSDADGELVGLRLMIPRYLVNVPVLLGLTGTLWGLSLAITEIQPLISGINDFKDLPVLLAAMVETLTGMKTAFATSIVGIGASIVLSAAGTITAFVATHQLNQLDRATAAHVARVLNPDWESAAVKFAKALETGTEELGEMVKSMAKVGEKFEGSAEKTATAAVSLGEAASEFAGAVPDFVETETEMRKDLGRVASVLEGIQQDVQGLKATLAGLQTKSEAGMDCRDFSDALSKVNDGVRTVVSDVRKIADGSPELYARALQEVRDESKGDLVRMVDSVDDGVRQRLDVFTSAVQQLLASLERNQAQFATAMAGGRATRDGAQSNWPQQLSPNAAAQSGYPAAPASSGVAPLDGDRHQRSLGDQR